MTRQSGKSRSQARNIIRQISGQSVRETTGRPCRSAVRFLLRGDPFHATGSGPRTGGVARQRGPPQAVTAELAVRPSRLVAALRSPSIFRPQEAQRQRCCERSGPAATEPRAENRMLLGGEQRSATVTVAPCIVALYPNWRRNSWNLPSKIGQARCRLDTMLRTLRRSIAMRFQPCGRRVVALCVASRRYGDAGGRDAPEPAPGSPSLCERAPPAAACALSGRGCARPCSAPSHPVSHPDGLDGLSHRRGVRDFHRDRVEPAPGLARERIVTGDRELQR